MRTLLLALFVLSAESQTMTSIAGGGPHNLPALLTSVSGVIRLSADDSGNLYALIGPNNDVWKVGAAGQVDRLDPAAAAQIPLRPGVTATDAAGNVYTWDQFSYAIRKISPAGASTVIVQGGFQGLLSQVTGLAVDSTGTLYFTDSLFCSLRKIVNGVISAVAGTGVCGYNGDAGPADATQLSYLYGIAIDQFDNIYLNERTVIREIEAGQKNIKIIGGSQTAGFSGDGGPAVSATFGQLSSITVDSSQNIYVYDSGNLRIRKISQGIVSTVAGSGRKSDIGEGGLATNAFIRPYSLALDDAGSLLFADVITASILKVSLSTGILSKEAGANVPGISVAGDPTTSPLNYVRNLVHGKNGTYFTDGNKIRRFLGGTYFDVTSSMNAGFSGDGGPATDALFNRPNGLALAANGDLYVNDSLNARIRVINGQTGIVTTIAGTGVIGNDGDGGLAVNAATTPSIIALDGLGNLYFGAGLYYIRRINLKTNIVTTVAGNGTSIVKEGVPATQSGLNTVSGLFGDQSGNVFFADFANARIRRIDAETQIVTTVAGNGNRVYAGDGGPALIASFIPEAILVDPAQNLYIADDLGGIRTTKVTACFFTASAPSFPVKGNVTTVSLTITATNPNCRYNVTSDSPFLTLIGETSGVGNGTITFTLAANPGQTRTATVNLSGVAINISQAGKFAQDNIGYFQPVNGPLWVLNSSGTGTFNSADKTFPFAGQAGVTAVTGDWNGDGHTKVGYVLNGFWVLDYNGNGVFDAADKFFAYGTPGPGYVPVVGDWNGDGRAKVGFYNDGFWALDTNGNGVLDAADPYFHFGGSGSGEVPLIGDWNGDGRSKVGYFFDGTWELDLSGKGSSLPGTYLAFNFYNYAAGDKPVVGDWSGDGKTKIGIYRSGSWVLDYNGNGSYEMADKFYRFGGETGDLPIVGDWNGDGTVKIGTYNGGLWTLDFNGNGVFDQGDRATQYGVTPGNQPLIGHW